MDRGGRLRTIGKEDRVVAGLPLVLQPAVLSCWKPLPERMVKKASSSKKSIIEVSIPRSSDQYFPLCFVVCLKWSALRYHRWKMRESFEIRAWGHHRTAWGFTSKVREKKSTMCHILCLIKNSCFNAFYKQMYLFFLREMELRNFVFWRQENWATLYRGL